MTISIVRQVIVCGLLGSCLLNGIPACAEDEIPVPDGLVCAKSDMPIELVGSLKSLNERLASAVSPERNAVNWLLIAIGADAFEPELKSDSLAMLGLKTLPAGSPQFVPLGDFAKFLDGVPPEMAHEAALQIQDELFAAAEAPWPRERFPRLVSYFEANGPALKTIAAASRQPGYYAPLLSVESPPRLMGAALNIERRFPFLARMYNARAMLALQEGRLPEAIDDLMTCHRLARLLAVGSPMDVSQAKAHVVDAFAARGEMQLLASGKVQGEVLESLTQQFRSLPDMPTADLAAGIGERAIVHQEIELLSTDPLSVAGFFEEPGGSGPGKTSPVPSMETVKWQAAIGRADEIWDEIVTALATRDREQQRRRFVKLDEFFASIDGTADEHDKKFAEQLLKDPVATSRWVGESLATALRPILWQRRLSDDRSRARHDLVALGLALLNYHAKQGQFPAQLEALQPEFLAALPPDAHSDGSYLYFRDADHAVRVMTLGANLKDDAGSLYNDDTTVEIRWVEQAP